MSAPILVTGGTGTLGRLVVARLLAAGRDVRVLSRTPRDLGPGVTHLTGDLATGEGVGAALEGADVVVHCAGGQLGDGDLARVLVPAAAAAGVTHLVHVSVVGCDRTPVRGRADRAMFGYLADKLDAERVVTAGEVPWSILRATQFHELLDTVATALGRLPVQPVPAGFRFQPVAAAQVADRLTELALGDPAGLAPDAAGPEVLTARAMLRAHQRAHGRRRPVLPLPLPGAAARAFRHGANLSAERASGGRTWAEHLADGDER